MYPNLKNNSHIFTPLTIAKEMIDVLPDDVWNSKSTFLDVCCKSGALLYEIYAKLMDSEALMQEFPDTGDRRKHIVTNQIFGISPDQACQLLSTRAVYGCIVENSHIVYLENYTNVMTNSDTRFLIETLKREFGTMKFDVVVGNPPYQESTGGRNSVPLYHKFMALGMRLADNNTWITPSRWFSGGIGLDAFRHDMLSSNRIGAVKNYRHAQKVFSGVDIGGGVCITNICRHSDRIKFIDGETNESIYIDDSFVKENWILMDRCEAYSIVNKTKTYKNLSSTVLPLNAFGIPANFSGQNTMDAHNNIEVIGSYNSISYINKSELEKGIAIIDKYKVITGKVNPDRGGVNNNSASNVINKPKVLKPNQVCTFSYMVVGVTHDEISANNIHKYIKTKFVRFLVLATLVSMNISAKNFRFVPMQDFTVNSDIDWSQSMGDIDKQLYKKYGLTTEEIAYIEKIIKPMD